MPRPRTNPQIKSDTAPVRRPQLEVIAELFHARRVGPGRYKGRCPGPLHTRGDRDPSLDITAGRDGRVLVLCRVGCETEAVLKAAGLRWRDLFVDGPPLSRAEQAALKREHEKRESYRRGMREHYRTGAARLRGLYDLLHSLAPKLMDMPDREEADRTTKVYHETLDRIRYFERVLDSIERCL